MENTSEKGWLTPFIHRFTLMSADAPTVLLLHGTGGNEDSLMGLGAELFPSANLLSPRGKVTEHGMPRFFRRLSEGVFDEEDLHRRTAELAAFVREATTIYGLKSRGVIGVGYSNGANIAASLLLSDPNLLAAAVLFRAMVPFEPAVQPVLPKTPILLTCGERDPLVPVSNAKRLAQLLSNAGARVDHRFFDAGHALLETELDIARRFLATVPDPQ